MVLQPGESSAPRGRGANPRETRAPRHGRTTWRLNLLERLESRCVLSSVVFPAAHAIFEPRAALPARSAVVSNVVYETVAGRQEQLDLYLPTGSAPPSGWPVLIAIHGGGWRRFDKQEYGPKVAAMFVPKGVAVVAMNYTLSAPGVASWPANFEDVRNAVRWARSNAGQFGLDPSRFAAIGESAGGHLAALLGTNPDGPITTGGDPAAGDVYGSVSARVQAVVDFYGPTNLAVLDARSPEAAPAIEQFLGGTPAQVPQNYADASPVDHVTPASPPMLILQGTADTLVTPDQPRALADVLTQSGVANRLITVAGAPHGFEFQPSGGKLVPVILAFLRTVWQG